jgi:GNAT superfamily N-acetyltransferase
VNPAFQVELLADRHDRIAFSCGVEALDRYFRQQAGQDVKRRLAACFVAVECETQRAVGYYTLSMTGVAIDDLPSDVARRFPRYPLVPAARLGRLAIDTSYRGRGLGGALLWDAARRTVRSDVAAFAVLVDAKDDDAVGFHRHHGFIPLARAPRTLFLPIAKVAARLER